MIRSLEEVAICLASEQGSPAPPPVLRPIMVHVAALTEGGEIAIGIVGRVVIAVRCGQHDLRGS